MLLGVFLSAFGAGNLPSARAQEAITETPTPPASSTLTPTEDVQALYGADCSSDAYGYNQDSSYFTDVLNLMGIPVSQFGLDAFAAWQPYENTPACWNPLATTYHVEWFPAGTGCTETIFNDHGVRNYSSKYCGELATARTLLYSGSGSYYKPIRDMLSQVSFNWQSLHDSIKLWVGSEAYATSITNEWQTLWNNRGGTGDCPTTISDWKGEYWNNRTLSGNPILCRNDGSVDFDWGGGGPGSGVPDDNFSARWTRNWDFTQGRYRFHLRGDDGIRLWVDGNLIIDQWKDQSSTEYTADIDLSGGSHSLKVEYYENGGGATVALWWDSLSSNCPTISDWKGEYWNNRTLSGNPILCRNDGSVDFDWGDGGPGNGVPNDNFSARWTRNWDFTQGRYRFHLRGDDGIRLWVDGNLIIDQWKDQPSTEYTADIDLSGGSHSLKVEYYENGGGASVALWWDSISVNSGNLALNRPAYATSQQGTGYEPYRANDGSTTTRWSSKISTTLGDEWWWVDLGSQSYNTVTIRWETAYATHFYIGWSDDGINFTGYWYDISAPGTYSINIGSHNNRYVGILMRTRAPQMNNYSFWEFEVYSYASTAVPEIDDGTEILLPEGDPINILRIEE